MYQVLVLLVSVISTIFIGSLAGYFAHRLMHVDSLKLLYRSHNIHHTLYTVDDFVSSKYRSAGKNDSSFVFAPVIIITLVLLFIVLWFAFGEWWIYPILLAVAGIVGYANTKMHECFHIRRHRFSRYAWFRELKRLHMLHHMYPKTNMGIVWFIPDKIFGTFKDE